MSLEDKVKGIKAYIRDMIIEEYKKKFNHDVQLNAI